MHALKICLLIILYALVPCRGDHFRGGTISWRPTGNGREVEFKYKLGWRYNRGAGCDATQIGRYVNNVLFNWNCISGCGSLPVTLSSAGYICTAASSTQDWEQGEYTFKYRFSSDGEFTVTYESCCWIDLDYGKGDGMWRLSTTVDLRTRSDLKVPNSSPVASGKPIYNVKYGCTQKIKIPVVDKEGDNVRCRWAAGDECSSVCRRIPNTVLHEDECTLTISATVGKDDMYAVAIMVEDRPTSTISLNGQVFTPQRVLSSVPVQFLVNTPDIPSRACSDRPVFVYPTPEESEVIVVLPGKSLFVTFYASSRGTSIQSFLLIGPPGLRQSSIRQIPLRPGVYSTDVMWTPSAADRGPQSLCAEATDSYLISSDMRCITIAAWDIDPCVSTPCQNNGTCSRVGYTKDFVCACSPGYTDMMCQTDINECASNPCQNGATCFDLINEYFCGCVDGYTDVNCQTDIDECELQACLNGGTCQDHVNAAVCTCPPGFTGAICQTGIDLCESDPCQNNGLCQYNETTGYDCECKDGWYGAHCAVRHENETFYNSTLMSADYMHYSRCDCFFGHDKQELCYIYNSKKGIGFGATGVLLGILTAVTMYGIIECCFNKHGPCFQTEQADRSINVTDKDERDDIKTKETDEDEHLKHKKAETVKHRHRKCWACDVKHKNELPPLWFIK